MKNFEQKFKKHMDASIDNLSSDISRQLQQARVTAVEKIKVRSLWSYYPQAIAVTFAMMMISISIWFYGQNTELNETAWILEVEIEMLTENESFELLEDIEFMQWLAETQAHAS